ncbi:hypothetical protein ANN_07901 [Periplaneta americana]|uniref:DDE-1 domain-containing protein n=1 Tax=Periplaneta americana TaxID=6978 RepID=A0ABQ8T1A6_PERAM|nr:hypothetical protein ANN_07901 [Periplaneta americana]
MAGLCEDGNEPSGSLKAISVKNGMPLNTAATRYGIARNTLRYHVNARAEMKNIGRPALLSFAQEREFCSRLFRLADVGMPLISKLVKRTVFTFYVSKRKVQTLNQGRAMKLNRVIVKDYFDKLEAIMVEHGFMGKPENIYKIDEKECRLTLHHTQEVFATKETKRLHLIAPEHGENVTIVTCCNVVGQAIPPMIVFKGKRRRPEWGDDMLPGTAVKMTEKGSMTCQVFIKWLAHFAKFKTVGKSLFIFDGAKSHLDANIVDIADEHDIILFCLPSNCTHELQPLDKTVFGPFEKY